MVKLFLGLLKGAVIGAGVGFGAFQLGNATGFSNGWLTYGVIGALVGVICGQAIWSLLRDPKKTNLTAVVKAVFGFGIGCGLYAIVAKAVNPSAVMVAGHDIFTWPVTLGGAIGAVYGAFVELDDSVGDPPPQKKLAKKATAADDE
ncbi:MAG: hypothetical protein NT062_18575 [Proteobacteria bacterium]|nr:hypothetical protein [Pseudomonadota bacterium]